ncbi:MAG: 1-acyl-sn-glycerol-3-phosphate acyltransferase [Myxococcota bacterium]|nr:1-acyl-sn-glycerol-3-phosphate acyltransferase [Myxococcota bacterium]
MNLRLLIRRLLRLVTTVFFRRVEVTGLEHIPATGGGVLVSWHPNGMIDPALILDRFPRRLVFGARDGLFRWPGLGFLMRALGTVPIYRAEDRENTQSGRRLQANRDSLGALAREVAGGSFACLFPEGDSHDSPHLLELKTGAARFYFEAREQTGPDQPAPVILPVGLFYDRKRSFRSKALLAFHPPIELPPELRALPPADADHEDHRSFYRAVTEEIDRVLTEVVRATEDWELHFLMHRSRKLVRAERAARSGATSEAPSMTERILGFYRVWLGYYARLKSHPEEVAALRQRVADYDADLQALGMEDHELDRDPRLLSRALIGILLLQALAVFVLFPPFLLLGYVVNGPTALLLLFLARKLGRRPKDEASIKALAGILFFPLTWAAWGTLAWFGHISIRNYFPNMPDTPLAAALVTVVLGIAGGALALHYLRLARETSRAIRVRLTRRRRQATLEHLLAERRILCSALESMSVGLELPGTVAEDGRILSEPG